MIVNYQYRELLLGIIFKYHSIIFFPIYISNCLSNLSWIALASSESCDGSCSHFYLIKIINYRTKDLMDLMLLCQKRKRWLNVQKLFFLILCLSIFINYYFKMYIDIRLLSIKYHTFYLSDYQNIYLSYFLSVWLPNCLSIIVSICQFYPNIP